MLKLLRLIHIDVLHHPFELIINCVFDKRDHLFRSKLVIATQVTCWIVLILHYLGSLWLFVGSEYFEDFEAGHEPWRLTDDDFKNMS